MRVLHIEDDPVVAEIVKQAFAANGFDSSVCGCAEDGLDFAKTYAHDAIVTDISLPDLSGFVLIKRLRHARIKAPILVLSGSTPTVADTIKALDLGADDYMTKPFHPDELVARIRAMVRRSNGHLGSMIVAGNVILDLRSMQVMIGGVNVYFLPTAMAMLKYLMLRKRQAVSKEDLLHHLYGDRDAMGGEATLAVHMTRLRKKLAETGCTGLSIDTVWGYGYRLDESPPRSSETVTPQKHGR